MSDSIIALQRKIKSASELGSVVRTMKAMAAASISQYEQAVMSLKDYQQTVQLGLVACLHKNIRKDLDSSISKHHASMSDEKLPIGVIIFGSDQGLVGQFNDTLLSFVKQTLGSDATKALYWPVGERMHSRIIEGKFSILEHFLLPHSMNSITSLVTKLLLEIESQRECHKIHDVYLFFNQPTSLANYIPTWQRLFPLNIKQQKKLQIQRWPGNAQPQLIDGLEQTLISLIHEYLFVSLFKACAESLASENASRLTAMQRAEKNIEELQDKFYRSYHLQRQQKVDEELFDLVSGFEALQVDL